MVHIQFTAESTRGPGSIAVNVETNIAETQPYTDYVMVPFSVNSPWWSGSADVRARRAGVIPEDMAYVHRKPLQEPLLWLADGLAGAVRSGTLLRDMTWLRLLPDGLVTIRRFATTDLRGEAR